MTIRDPQVNMKYLIIFLVMDYNVLTKMCYKVQINSKITDLDGYSSLQDLQCLNLFESEYILQWLCWDTGEYFSFFYYFFYVLAEFSQQFCYDLLLLTVSFNIGCFSFHSVSLGSRGTTDSPLWLPGYQSPCCSSPFDD